MYQITGEHPWWNAMSIKFQIALRHGCSPVNLQHIFRTTFPKNTSGGLLLSIVFNIFQYFYSKCCRLLDSIETNGSVLTKGINILASSRVLSFIELSCVLSFIELSCVPVVFWVLSYILDEISLYCNFLPIYSQTFINNFYRLKIWIQNFFIRLSNAMNNNMKASPL